MLVDEGDEKEKYGLPPQHLSRLYKEPCLLIYFLGVDVGSFTSMIY